MLNGGSLRQDRKVKELTAYPITYYDFVCSLDFPGNVSALPLCPVSGFNPLT